MSRIVVLNDGETFSDAFGCKVVEISEDLSSDEIEERLKELRDDGSAEGLDVVMYFSEDGSLQVDV